MEKLIKKVRFLEKRYCTVIENTRDAFCVTDGRGKFLYLNNPAIELFGYSHQELKDLHLADLFLNSTIPEQLYNRVKRFGRVKNFEAQLKKKNNTTILCSITMSVVLSDAGEIAEYHCIVNDITPNKRAEDKLKTSQKYTQSIIDSSMDMIIASDQNRKIIEFNKAAERTFGYKRAEIMGEPVAILYDDETEGKVVHNDTLHAGQKVQQVLCRRKNGESFPAFLSSSVLRNNMGEIVGVMGISRDITIEKQKESELKRLSTAIEQTADSIVITAPDGIIQYVNPAYEKLTGFSKKEFIGKKGFAVDIEAKNTETTDTIWKALKRGEVWNGGLVNHKKDGTAFEEETTISPVKDDHGKIINYVAIKRDITERRRLESVAEATNLMQNLGYIFSGIRHEIGNPVNSIKMALTVLIKNIDKYPKERIFEFVQRAFNEISRVEYLLKALKNMSMYESLKIKKVQMDAFMNKFLPLVQEDFEKRGIKINMDQSASETNAYTDPRALHQVLLNILINAADALEGRDDPQITIRMESVKDRLQISISDNGCGLTEEEQKNIFKPFFTTKPEGTGLGLMIVKKTLSKMDSTISVNSCKNLGTNVTIAMPVNKNDNTQ